MIIFESKNSDLTVTMRGKEIDDIINMRGLVVTNSINEIKKPFAIRTTIDPSDVKIDYISDAQYKNLITLIGSDGNLFTITTSEGDFFDNCFISENPSLIKSRNKNTNERFRSGTLKVTNC